MTRILPIGPRAFLVELADLDATLALFDALAADPVAGVSEIVPAARTLMVTTDAGVAADAALARAVLALALGLLLLLGTVSTRWSRREAVLVFELAVAVAGCRCCVYFLRITDHPGRLRRRVSCSQGHVTMFVVSLGK